MNQAVILAGGEGSRLLPLTAWIPKPLLPIRGVPILVHILRKLKAEGWDDVVVCIND
ncbi:MAG: sugar phosphate nucleotidyltransferase, partial [Thermoplasmata archaeon]